MADTLDLCARFTDPAALEGLTPALCQLIKRGVGLNTKVGTARFVTNLASRLAGDIRPQTGTLLKVGTPTCIIEWCGMNVSLMQSCFRITKRGSHHAVGYAPCTALGAAWFVVAIKRRSVHDAKCLSSYIQASTLPLCSLHV